MAAKRKILICEDEKGVRESLEFVLRRKYELSFACDGFEALAHIKKHRVDMMLLDLKMPKLDGMKVLKEVKKIKPKIKVIVLTGYSSMGTAYRAIETGASDYITKPFDKAQIVKAIEKVLEK